MSVALASLNRRDLAASNLGVVPDGLRLGFATPAEIDEIKALDDLAFGVHQGITHAELQSVLDRGFIITLRDQLSNALVGQSQLFLEPQSEHVYCPSTFAYCYGTALSPVYLGRRLGALLANTQELLAKQAGRGGLFLSARLENAISLRLRLRQGFVLSGCAPDFYGEGQSAARVLLTKAFDRVLSGWAEPIRVPIRFGDVPDANAFEHARAMLNAGKIGVDIDDYGVTFAKPTFQDHSRALHRATSRSDPQRTST